METGRLLSTNNATDVAGTDWLPELRPLGTPLFLRYALSVFMVAAATMIAIGFDRHISIPNISLIYVVPVIVSAVFFGFWPSVLASILGALAYNFFFTEPRLTLQVDDPANIWAIGLLFGVGCIASAVASTARRRADNLALVLRHQVELGAFGKRILAANAIDDALDKTAELLSDLFGCAVVVAQFRNQSPSLIRTRGDVSILPIEIDAAASAARSQQLVKADVYPFDASRFDFWPTSVAADSALIVGVAFESGSRPQDPDAVIEVVATIVALALARLEGIETA